MKNLIKLPLVALFTLLLFSCSKDSTSPALIGTGSYTFSGTTYQSFCIGVSATLCNSGLDVTLSHQDNDPKGAVAIYNMPSASSGTFSIVDGEKELDISLNPSLKSCKLFVILSDLVMSDGYVSKSGTLTKTGPKSFTFTCSAIDLTTNQTKVITGKGTYITP
ncbi:MAG: hypothetical protein ACK50E_00400 [Bacteroidota bacterium]|jgi:hypothetical protein